MDTLFVTPAAPEAAAPTMTNLEAQERCQRDYLTYAAEATDDISRAFWTALAATCEINIAGILATGNDDFIPF
jgi:hypothetical protein